jgi:hypothetical protein
MDCPKKTGEYSAELMEKDAQQLQWSKEESINKVV